MKHDLQHIVLYCVTYNLISCHRFGLHLALVLTKMGLGCANVWFGLGLYSNAIGLGFISIFYSFLFLDLSLGLVVVVYS